MSSSSSTIPWAVGAPRRMHSEEQSSCAGLLRGTCRDTRRVATDPSSRWLPVSLGEQELHLLQRACLEARRLVDPAPNRNPSGSCGSPLDSACQVGADKISFPPPLVEQSDPPSLPGVTWLATDAPAPRSRETAAPPPCPSRTSAPPRAFRRSTRRLPPSACRAFHPHRGPSLSASNVRPRGPPRR